MAYNIRAPMNVVTITGDTTLTADDIGTLVKVNLSSSLTVTLPTITNAILGKDFVIKNNSADGTNTITVARGGSDTIEGVNSVVIQGPRTARRFTASTASNWMISDAYLIAPGYCNIRSSTTQAFSNATVTTVVLDTTTENYGYTRAGGELFTVGSNGVTINQLGWYNVTIISNYFSAITVATATDGVCKLALQSNGAEPGTQIYPAWPNYTGSNQTLSHFQCQLSYLYRFAAGIRLNMEFTHNWGSSKTSTQANTTQAARMLVTQIV